MAERPSEKRIAASLRACYREGMAAQLVTNVFDYYLIPFGISLEASTAQLGLLVSLPNLAASLSFLFAVRVVRHFGSRLQVLINGVGAQTGLMLLMTLLSVVALPSKIAVLAVLAATFRLIGGLMGPAWGSLVSEYLPADQRGSYFGSRARAVNLSGIAGLVLWGSLLWLLQSRFGLQGFLVLFLGATAFRMLSFYYMTHLVDLPLPAESGNASLWRFVREFRGSNLGRFVLYVVLFTFGTQVCAPYFSVRMLRELHFDYLAYTCVHLAAVVASVLAFPMWGRRSDAVGTARILKLTGLSIPFIPLLWMLARHPVELIAVELLSGLLWSGFNLCVTNYIYDAVSAGNRMRTLAYFNLLNGAAAFGGASLGGLLAERLPAIQGSSLLSLFLISAMLRLAINGLFVRGFQETRVLAAPVRLFVLPFGAPGGREGGPLRVKATRAWHGAKKLVARSERP
jgi:MFS family permease